MYNYEWKVNYGVQELRQVGHSNVYHGLHEEPLEGTEAAGDDVVLPLSCSSAMSTALRIASSRSCLILSASM